MLRQPNLRRKRETLLNVLSLNIEKSWPCSLYLGLGTSFPQKAGIFGSTKKKEACSAGVGRRSGGGGVTSGRRSGVVTCPSVASLMPAIPLPPHLVPHAQLTCLQSKKIKLISATAPTAQQTQVMKIHPSFFIFTDDIRQS